MGIFFKYYTRAHVCTWSVRVVPQLQLLDASSDDESSDAAAPSTPACASPRRNHTSALVGFRGASVYSAVPFPTVQVLHVYKRESMLIVFRLARTQITEHTSLSVGAVETERNPN